MPRVQANGVDLNYDEAGRGPEPLVLIHGYQGSRRVWGEVVKHFPLDRVHVYVFDLRGCGESEQPPSGYTMAQYADDVAAAMTALGHSTFHYAGVSMGGITGMQMGIRHPDRLRTLTLLAPAPSTGFAGADWSAAYMEQMRKARSNPSLFREAAKGLWVRELPESLWQWYVEDAIRCSIGHFEQSWADMEHMSIAGALAGITTPTLMVAGDRDFLLQSNLEDRARIPNCGLHVFYRCGHFISWDKPQEFAALLADFMKHGAA